MSSSTAAAATAATAAGGRRTVDFNQAWRFSLANLHGATDPHDQLADAAAPDFDDSGWRVLNLPHDWSIELPPVETAGTAANTGFFHGGLGWYRKVFTVPPAVSGRRVCVEFDGVYMDSSVYCNGALVGRHAYGYTGFSVDLTGRLHCDGVTANVLAVQVRHRLPSSRWYSGSGIYRNVRLHVTGHVYVRRWGTQVTTPGTEASLAAGVAAVLVRTEVANDTGTSTPVRVTTTVLDDRRREVGRAVAAGTVPPGGRTVETAMQVSDPVLWSIEEPYVYTLHTELVADDRPVDLGVTPFGFRHARFDPDRGFFLNGRRVELHGVNLHHDLGALGAAVHPDAVRRQVDIMRRMGANAVRTAHHPPAPELVDACERSGMLLIIEAFDCWRRGKNAYDYGRFFDAYSDADITEMVRAARNSPAVIMWSIGNEIPDGVSPAAPRMARRLVDAVRREDDTRPVVLCSDQFRDVPDPESPRGLLLATVDGLGVNYNTAESMDALHAAYPRLFLFESESAAQCSTRGVYAQPEQCNTGENHVPGRRGASSYDNALPAWGRSGEYVLKAHRDRDFLAGHFLWAGMDYLGEPTPYHVFPVKSSFFGAVDTAGFPKDLFYLFQSRWSEAPMVHLVPMDWTTHRSGELVEVWAYSNVDTVELFLNGRSLGVRSFDLKRTLDDRRYLETTETSGDYTSPNGDAGRLHLTWRVPFAPGTLTGIARRDGVAVARDELHTAGPGHTIRLTPEPAVVAAGGSPLSFVTVEVIDRHGVPVPDAGQSIEVHVDAGDLVGLDNGRQESAEPYQATRDRSVFNGRALAIVRCGARPGTVVVTATAPGLLPGTAAVHVVPPRRRRPVVALDPVWVRVADGEPLRLPSTVTAHRPDAGPVALPVRWRRRTPVVAGGPRRYDVRGDVPGTRLRARAVVTVYAPVAVQTWAGAVPPGGPATLPSSLLLVHSDGTQEPRQVQWDPLPLGALDRPGVTTVGCTVAGTRLRSYATVRVAGVVGGPADLAADGGLPAAADASYCGSPATPPSAMLDGSPDTGWSNAATTPATALLPAIRAARAADWVSVAWPAPQRIGAVVVTFMSDRRHALPSGILVRYEDRGALVPVRAATLRWEGATATVAFEPIGTDRIRLDLVGARPGKPDGNLGIVRLAVPGTAVAHHRTASLARLCVDGHTVAGFDPAVTDYLVTGRGVPHVEATAADNGRLLIFPATGVPRTVRVVVTAEDGVAQRTYTVRLDPVAAPSSPSTPVQGDSEGGSAGWPPPRKADTQPWG